jgi:hypothetical protein
MPTTSEIVGLVLSDLATLGVIARPGQALTAAIPSDSPTLRVAFSRPDILETPSAARPGSPDGSALITLLLVFQAAGHVGLQGAIDPPSLGHYDLGYHVRSRFHAPTAHVRTLANSAVVQRVEVRVGQENQAKMWFGAFELRVSFDEMPPETQSVATS